MPSSSKAQQAYFGMVSAGKIKKPSGMTGKEVRKMAATKTKGMPEHVMSSLKKRIK